MIIVILINKAIMLIDFLIKYPDLCTIIFSYLGMYGKITNNGLKYLAHVTAINFCCKKITRT